MGYVDINKLKEAYDAYCKPDMVNFALFSKMVNSLEIEDLEPVTRCENCVYYQEPGTVMDKPYCKFMGVYAWEDGYCYKGDKNGCS